MPSPDPYNLQRFIDAQKLTFDQACEELRAGQKQSHWMWFIFPQFKGLGTSEMAVRFAISSRGEAEAYLNHAVLGVRLKQVTELVTLVSGRSIQQIFGYPDDLKFRSSMTLFATVASDNRVFNSALAKYFAGKCDQRTIDLLGL